MTKPLLIAFFALVGLPLLLMGADKGDLLRKYQQADNAHKASFANQLCAELADEGITDTLYHFRPQTPTRVVDFYVNYLMSACYNERSLYDSAVVCGQNALACYEKDDIDRETYCDCLSTLSIALQRKGLFYQALQYQEECYRLDLESGIDEDISSSANNMAALYLSLKQYNQAEAFIRKAIEIEERLNRHDRLAIRYGMASEIYMKLGQPQKALDYASRAYDLDHREQRDAKAAIRLSQMSAALVQLGQWQKARQHIEKAMPILKACGNINSLSICEYQMGLLLQHQGESSQAADYLMKALEHCQTTGNLFVERNVHHTLSEVLRHSSPTEAYDHLLRYAELSDSMYKEETSSLLSQYEAQYKTKEAERKASMLDEENQSHKRTMQYVVATFVLATILLAIVMAILTFSLRARTKTNALMESHQRMRLNFFNRTAHEFRTPLTVIIGLSESIETGRAKTHDDIVKAAQVINRNGYHMQRLTNQLLELAKIKSEFNVVKWKHGPIVAYTEMIVDSFAELARQQGKSLHYIPAHKETDIVFDPDLYDKMLYNFISNSLKYTDEGGNILVGTSIENGWFVLSITDTGRGISEKDLPHIFEEFYTSDTQSSSFSTGVGLSLVKQIVNRLKGNIQVKSVEGKGTTFVIRLPLLEHHADYPAVPIEGNAYKPKKTDDIINLSTEEETEDNSLPRVLIVEDNNDVLEYIGQLLRSDYNIIYANDGEEGLRKANEQVPDLIVSDLMMPGIDGFQLCKAVRESMLLSHIPFIVITAKTQEEDRLRALQAGADAYLAKPFSANELLVRARQLILQREKLRERFSQSMAESDNIQAKDQLSADDKEFLDQLANAVNEQMKQGSVDVETTASRLCLSSRQLRRKIYAITGETTVACIMRLRLARAHQLLVEHPSLTISEVAMKCGFDDSGYFTKAFKQQYKMTPTQLRKR